MFSNGQLTNQANCANGGYIINGQFVTSATCGLPCDACPALTRTGLTCPSGATCTTVSLRNGQCKEAFCPDGVMTADGVQVTFLTCNREGQWVDGAGVVYTAAQCEISCANCAALTNNGMPCPTGRICELTAERQDVCKERFCPEGAMTGNIARTALTLLTCNEMSQWVDAQNAVYTTAQCEIPCDQCTALGVGTCPTGFVCTAVVTETGKHGFAFIFFWTKAVELAEQESLKAAMHQQQSMHCSARLSNKFAPFFFK
ncbi:unnamed protein product [Strongylus vulgaris]|uniref:Uncharacterized protein n=1 Tax=Strongylus vulgaris TaxID=40348 RepID=A0A3P7J578_STRVU|nr:unnamed protein product [Strongylus vulgaris]